MLKRLKLGAKVGGGFGFFMGLIMLAGLYIVINTIGISKKSTIMAEEYVPQMEYAIGMERNALQAFFELRGFAYTEQESYLEAGKKLLGQADLNRDSLIALSKRAEHLDGLDKSIKSILKTSEEYKKQLLLTVQYAGQVQQASKEMIQAYEKFSSACDLTLKYQYDKLNLEIAKGASASTLKDRVEKIEAINETVSLGLMAQAGLWKAKADFTPEKILDAIGLFDEAENLLHELQRNTKDAETRQSIAQALTAGTSYKEALHKYHDSYMQRVSAEVVRVPLALELVEATKNLRGQGMEKTRAVSVDNSRILDSLTSTFIIIAALALIIGVMLARWVYNSIMRPLRQISSAAEAIALGDLTTEVTFQSYDQFGDLADSFRSMIESLRIKVDAAKAFAAGNLSLDIKEASDRDTLAYAMADMRNRIREILEGVIDTAALAQRGKLMTRIQDEGMEGSWKTLVQGINGVMDTLIGYIDTLPVPVMLIDKDFNINYMNTAGAQLRNTTGDALVGSKCHDFFKTGDCKTENCASFQAIRGNKTVNRETDAHPGKLDLDISYSGSPVHDENGDVVGAFEFFVDQTADKQIQRKNAKIAEFQNREVEKLSGVLDSMSMGDLTVDYSTASYDEDTEVVGVAFQGISQALGKTLLSLNEIMGQVQVAVEQVNSGAGQVSSASQSLSQGATEQASSLEEVSASMTEVGSQTKQNADNAIQANQLASSARGAAEQGNSHMKGMLDAMKDINNKSAEIQKIVKAIDDIAFQTNLLALNAAVEAARAGVHGKGFAVVAEEVRNLAQRSATAAKETTDLIDSNVSAVTGGTKIADQTAQALGEITDGVTKVTDLINEIASASREQTMAVDQIAEALGQIDQVTQSNTASAEESAAAAEELSGQSTQLQEMISRFKLKKQQSRSTTPLVGGGMNRRSIEASDTHVSDSKSRDHHDKNRSGTQVNPRDVIELDDVDFKEF